MKTAICAFSGDPITKGHTDVINRALNAFDRLIVGIGINPKKKYTFSLEERLDMACKELAGLSNVEVVPFTGLLVDFAYEQGVHFIVKGVRNIADFEYEGGLYRVGESQKLGIDTFLLFARPELQHISSSSAKAVQNEHGAITDYVSLHVKQCLEARISGQYKLGIACQPGDTLEKIFSNIEQVAGKIPVYSLNLDEICSPFNAVPDEEKSKGISVRIRRELYGKKGLLLMGSTYPLETGISELCNNNVAVSDQALKSHYQGLINDSSQGRLWQFEASFPDDLPFQEIIGHLDKYLELRFRALWERIGADGTPDVEYGRIVDAYSKDGRFYHTLSHIAKGLDSYSKASSLMDNPDAVLMAWFYHDIEMNPKSKVDTERSAQRAYDVCRRAMLPEDFSSEVKSLVLDCAHKKVPTSNDGKIIESMDLAIFGCPEKEFDGYDKNIRFEFSYVPWNVFRERRISILQGFLDRDRIYPCDFFEDVYGQQARMNLAHAIIRLSN